MKAKATIFTCLALLLSPAAVIAGDGPYLSVHVGPSWLSDADLDGSDPGIRLRSEVEFDTGIRLGGALGYDFGEFRVEGQFGYHSHELEEVTDIQVNGVPQGDLDADGDLDAFILLANGLYDIDTGTQLTPYLGAGIGFAFLEVDDLSISGILVGDEDDTVFAYQLSGGVAYEITEQIDADLSYRFTATSEPDFDGVESDYLSHNLVAAIRLSFQ
jgi:opacity protein-like surface antigen